MARESIICIEDADGDIIEIRPWPEHVVSIGCTPADGKSYASIGVHLTPKQARRLAAALFVDAERIERGV